MNRVRFCVSPVRLFARGIGRRRCFHFCPRLLGVCFSFCGWQTTGARINALVNYSASQGIRAFYKNALDEFVIEEPRTVHELVEHPRGNLHGFRLIAQMALRISDSQDTLSPTLASI